MHRTLLLLALGFAACDTTDATDADTDVTDTEDTNDTEDTEDTHDTEDTDDTDVEIPAVQSLTVDATSQTDWVYLDLDAGTLLDLDEASAASSTEWELALRRSVIRTNGGTSGMGTVEVGLSDTKDDLYDTDGEAIATAFAALDDATEFALLEAPVAEPAAWEADSIDHPIDESWYSYNFQTAEITAVPEEGYLLRGGEGTSFARFHVTEMTFPTQSGVGITSFTIAFDVQPDGSTTLDGTTATFSGSIGSSGGTLCFDMDTDSTVACTGTAWDVAFGFEGFDILLYTNSGDLGEGDGGALGPYTWTELQAFTAADADPGGNSLAPYFGTEESASLLEQEGWYAYNLNGFHQLTPNYRTWLIDTASDSSSAPIYALQVTGYASGQVSLRWRALADTEPVAP